MPSGIDGGESNAETYGIEVCAIGMGRDDVSSSGFGGGRMWMGVGFRFEDFIGSRFGVLGVIGDRSCFGAMGNDSVRGAVRDRGARRGPWTSGGEVRAGGGGRGISISVVMASSSSFFSSSVMMSSFFGLAGRLRPRGMPRYPGDVGVGSDLDGVKKTAFGSP